jgi:hypothetical protein
MSDAPPPRVIGAVSRVLRAWIADGRPYPHGAAAALRQYAWSRCFFGLNLALQNKLHPPQPLAAPPLFILGLWRSGTTFLHELLAANPALCTPRTWQCMAPSTFALTGRPPGDPVLKRPMDDFTISSSSPQEDEFALLMLGAQSVYRGFIDPRRLRELQALLDQRGAHADAPLDSDWLLFLQTVNTLEGPRRRLLLKSPNHSFRTRALLRQFPGAPLVWMTRDPLAILHSNLKMWRQMTALYGLAPAPEGAIEHFLVHALSCAAEALTTLSTTLPRGQLVVVALDELRTAPVARTLAVLGRLGLPAGDEVNAAIESASRDRAEVRPDDYTSIPDLAGSAEALARLAQAQAQAHRTHGLAD